MKYVPFTFNSKDGLILQGRAWLSQQLYPKGIVHILHDLGEHTARFALLGEVFSQAGYHFLGFDLRGHGLSEGNRGHSPGYVHLMNDIEQFINQSTEILGLSDQPKILYGQGLGGNLAINYILRRRPNISGVIVTSPIFRTTHTKTKIQRAWLEIIANIVPKLKFHNHIKSEDLSRDLAVVKAYKDDVYIHKNISARLALDIYRSGKYALENAGNFDLPLLLMHGTSDRITSPSVSKSFAEKVGNMADLVLWNNSYHELHNDTVKILVIEKMMAWLKMEIN